MNEYDEEAPVHAEFDARADAIEYPTADAYRGRQEARDRARVAYRAAHADLNRDFGVALAERYIAPAVDPAHLEAVAGPVYRAAWEQGHSAGYSEVENYYIDFAELATNAYTVARG